MVPWSNNTNRKTHVFFLRVVMKKTDKDLYINKFETVLEISNDFKFNSDDFNNGIKRLLKKDKSIK